MYIVTFQCLFSSYDFEILNIEHPDLQQIRVGKRFLYLILKVSRVVWSEPPGPEVIKLFSYSTQLSTKLILLINVKMPTITIVDILTFISMINTTSERLKARNVFICWYLSVYEQLNFRAQLS